MEDYNFDIPEGMDLMVHKRCRPDDGEAQSEDTVDMVPICQTMSCVTRIGPDEFSDTSGTETAVMNGHDTENFCQWSELSDEEDCFVSDVGSSVDSSLYMSEQEDLGYVDVESVVDFDSEDSFMDFCINYNEGSVAELEWNTWDDTCALDFQNMSAVFPPDSAVVRPAVNFSDNVNNMEDGGHLAWDVCNTGLSFNAHGYVGLSGVGYVDGDMYSARLCLLGPTGVENIRKRREEYVDIRRLSHRHTVRWDLGVADSRALAVCYDCLCLISLFRTVMSLSSDWDEVFGWTGHDEGYDRSPGWKLRYLPRCLYSLLVVDRMTPYLTEIKVPGWSFVLSEDMYTGARLCVCTRGTPLGVFSAGRISLTLIGHRASVGGSVGCSDWPRVDGTVDISAGGIWIDYIRPDMGDGTLIDAAPVTGSLVPSTLFSCRDVFCTAGSTSNWTFCGTDWVLPAGYQVFLQWISQRWTMDASGFSVVDNRAGITFGVELYVPWNAPRRRWWMFRRLVLCRFVTFQMSLDWLVVVRAL